MGVLRFDAFTLDLSRGVLRRGAKEIPLRPQSLKVLAHLAERSGQLVTTAELIDACWENPRQTNVNSLAQCVRDIREALGETEQSIIRTVPRKGYLFAAPASVAEAEPDIPPLVPHESTPIAAVSERGGGWSRLVPPISLRWMVLLLAIVLPAMGVATWTLWQRIGRPADLTMMAVPSVAVLPFSVIGANDQDPAGIALADDVATELLRMPRTYDVHIKSAPGYRIPSTGRTRAIGRDLGVRYLVVGNIRKDGGAAHLNVQLVEAESSHTVWAEPVRYALPDSAAQKAVVARLARAISAQVLGAEVRLPLPANPQAGHLVMVARSLTGGEHGIV